MSTPTKFEIVLSFKPVMDGLNRFVAGYQSRMLQVKAFNERIQNGEAALRSAIGKVGAVLGAAALATYAREARDADRVQQQLIQTLTRTGQTGALDALNAQAAALQKVTLFSDEAVTTTQRLLINFGLTAEQAQALSERVLDFAQQTGQSAESAAMLIGRTLAGDSDELGRYKIQLDTTKGKVDALSEALTKFSAGAARGAVADRAGRDVEARYADATEQLGRTANQVAVPFLHALIPLLERLAAGATALAEKLAPIAPMLGDMAAAILPGIIALGLLSGGMTALLAVVNPLRAGIVLFSGRSLVELSNALARSAGGAGGLWTALKGGGGALAGIGSALTSVASIATAAFAGWQLGTLVNELEYSGLKVKDWTALWLSAIYDTLGGAWAWLKKAWINTSFSLREVMAALLLWVREKQLAMQETLNELLSAWNRTAEKFGLNTAELYDTSAARAEVAALAKKLGELEQARLAALAAADKERAAQKADSESDRAFIADGEDAFKKPTSPGRKSAPTGGRENLNSSSFGSDEEDKKKRAAAAELEAKRAAYALETRILQARLAGDAALERSLTRQLDYQAAVNELGAEASALINQRLDTEQALDQQQRARQQAEQDFSRQIAALELELSKIEADKFTTQEEKDRLRVVKLGEINAEIAERIRLLEIEEKKNPDPDRQGKIDELRGQKNANTVAIDEARPLTFLETMRAKVASMETQLGSFASRVASAFATVGDSIRTSMGGAFADMILKGQNFKDAALGFGNAVLTSFVQNGAQMAADELYRLTILKAWRSMFRAADVAEESTTTGAKVAIHAGGETAKTGASAAGTVARKVLMIGETIFHGIQWTFRTAAHLAGEVANTTVTIAQKAIRLPLIIAESGAYLVKAGIGALSAMASIPYVGPILAVAAMGAILAAGAKLLGGFATGGLVTGPGSGTSDSIVARLSNGEFVNTAATVQRFGPGFFEGLEQGVVNLPSNMAAGLAQPYYPTGGGGGGGTGAASNAAASAGGGPVTVNVANFYDLGQATAWLQKQQGVRILNRVQTNNRSEFGLES